MILEQGILIGPYQILGMIGEGGMGAVYRALDTRLQREVAIKVLPQNLVQDEESRARFGREARMLAALNHRGIGAIYDVAEWKQVPCLVLELVHGQTLEQRLAQNPLTVPEAISLFIQAAEAVESAHNLGILHRDLKPGNMMITSDGLLKILDFGLAKALNCDFAGDAGLQTRDGHLLGTAAYFAPEQLYSAPLDQRVDVWALCCCLFQAVSGQQAFPARSLGETLNLIINKDPDWSVLPDHSELRALLQEGLRKDPRDRLSSAAALRQRLQQLAPIPEKTAPAPPRSSTPPVSGLLLMLCLILPVAGFLLGRQRPLPPTQKPRFLSFSLPDNTTLPDEHPQFALSPDGSFLVFAAVADGDRQLYRQELSGLQATPIGHTSGGAFPFFSADGQRLGYWAQDGLWSLPVGGGSPTRWVEGLAEDQFLGACWLADNSLVWATTSRGLLRQAAPTATPESLLVPDPKRQEAVIGWPARSGQGLIFSLRLGGTYENGRVEKLDLASQKRTVLQEQAYAGQPGPAGGLLFLRGRSLMLDSQVVVSDLWGDPTRGESCLSASRGLLAFLKASSEGGLHPLWVDRQGKEKPELSVPPVGADPRISPDGLWLAYRQISESGRELWVQDRHTGLCRRLTHKGNTAGVAIHPDSAQVAFGYDVDGPFNLYSMPLDGSKTPKRLTHSPHRQFPKCWSAGYLLYEVESPGSATDIWALPERGEPFAVVHSEYQEREPALSPDGRRLAYQSDRSGSSEVYLMDFPDGSPKSLGPGQEPTWSPTGQLYYRSGDQLMTIQDLSRPTPQLLFTARFRGQRRNWDVAPDGSAFFLLQSKPSSARQEISIGLNLPGL
ncbi:MAG: protein kinase [Vulcanimicrobiota bacterium]